MCCTCTMYVIIEKFVIPSHPLSQPLFPSPSLSLSLSLSLRHALQIGKKAVYRPSTCSANSSSSTQTWRDTNAQVLLKDGSLFGIGEPSGLHVRRILSLLWPFYLMHTLPLCPLPYKHCTIALCTMCGKKRFFSTSHT